MNTGSQAGDSPPPRLAVYGASKRFLEYLTRGLAVDEHYYTATNVKFLHLVPGQVSSSTYLEPESFLCPTSDTFAKAVVDRIGCNRRRISPYLNHAISQWAAGVFGIGVMEAFVAYKIKQIYWNDEKLE